MTLKNQPPKDFLQPEVRCDYRIDSDMKRVWAVQLDLLLELLRVCRKHDLRIFADGGTMLGAVRHKGYIPWDDDIDMAMFREDYDKLAEIAPQEFSHPYFFQTVYTDEHYSRRHAQLRNSETACWTKDLKKVKHNRGIFIDIFILDYMPNGAKAIAKHVAREKEAKLKLKITSKIINWLPESLYLYCRNHTRWLSDKVRFAQYEDLMRSVKRENTALICNISFRSKEAIKLHEYYDDIEWMDFEHIQIPVPTGYHKALTMQYGEYMTPKKIETNHGSMQYDTERSYRDIADI